MSQEDRTHAANRASAGTTVKFFSGVRGFELADVDAKTGHVKVVAEDFPGQLVVRVQFMPPGAIRPVPISQLDHWSDQT